MKKKRFNPIFLLIMLVFLIPLIPTGLAYWGIIDTQKFTPNTNTSGLIYVDNESNKFPTLESAASYAKSDDAANKIYLTPGVSSKPNIFSLKEDITITSGDSLILPYQNTTYKNGNDNWAASKSDFSKVSTSCVTRLNVKSGVNITIYGNLCVGGQTGNSGQSVIGHTSGLFTEIILGTGSSISVEGTTSIIEIYGYVRRSEFDHNNGDYTSSKFIMNKGTLYAPVVFYDFKGGTLSSKLKSNNIFPFSIFDIPNFEVKTIFKNGSKFIAQVKLEASVIGKKTNEMPFVGNGCLFDISESGAELSLTYIPSAYSQPTKNYFDDTTYTIFETTGNVTLKSASVSLGITSVNTKDYFLPISYKMKIKILKNSKFTTDYDVKILPGAEVIIEEGGYVIVGENAQIFVHDRINYQLSGAEDAFAYPYNRFNTGGYVENKGSLEVKGQAYGIVNAGCENSSIKFYQVPTTSPQIKEYKNGTPEYITISAGATAPKGYFESSDSLLSFSQGTYTSIYSETYSRYCWRASDADITINSFSINESTIKYNGGDYTVSSNISVLPLGASIIISLEINGVPIVEDEKQTDADADGKIDYSKSIHFQSSSSLAAKEHTITIKIRHAANSGITDLKTITCKQEGKYKLELTGFTANPNSIDSGSSPSFDYTVTITPAPTTNVYSLILIIGNKNIGYENMKISFNGNGVSTDSVTLDGTITDETTYTAWAEYSESTESISSNTKDATVSINSSGDGGDCLLPDTKVLLSNGQTKFAKDLDINDRLLTFDHSTGKFVERQLIVNVYIESQLYNIITLNFDNGKTLKIATGHGLFNVDKGTYEIYYGEQFFDHIGETFLSMDYNNGCPILEKTKLIGVKITKEYTPKYSPLTQYDINCVADGMLTIPDNIEGMLDSFTYKSDFTYDLDALQADIDKYGIYNYEDVKDVFHPYLYDIFNFKYWKAFIKKGTLTYDKVNGWIDRYMDQIVAFNNLDWDTSKQVPLGPQHG